MRFFIVLVTHVEVQGYQHHDKQPDIVFGHHSLKLVCSEIKCPLLVLGDAFKGSSLLALRAVEAESMASVSSAANSLQQRMSCFYYTRQ